jgi:transposase
MKNHLAAAVWAAVQPLLPEPPDETQDSRYIPDERVLEAIWWQARTGCPWRLLPVSFPSFATVFRRRRAWIAAGVFEALLQAALVPVPREASIDATFIEADSRLPEKAWTKIGQGLKIQAICGPGSHMSALGLSPASRGEACLAERLLRGAPVLPERLLGDAAYDTLALREHTSDLGINLITTNNWPRRTRSLDHPSSRAYARRNRWPVERLFAWLKAFAGVRLTRTHTLASYLVGLSLAIATINLRSL